MEVEQLKERDYYFKNTHSILTQKGDGYSNDYFDLTPKIHVVNKLLANKKFLEHHRMIAIYGPWGSGKSTLISTVANDMKDDFRFIFFNAWEMENDEDIALSFFETVLHELADERTLFDDLLNRAVAEGKSLLSLVKHITRNTNLGIVNIGKVYDDVSEETSNMEHSKSYLSTLTAFKLMFSSIVDRYYDNYGKRIVVVIDDLERCEPDKVLFLTSRVKQFFTYSSNMTIITNIDKEAVKNAVELRFSGIIKAEDYLEKIFDFSLKIQPPTRCDLILEEFSIRIMERKNLNEVYLIEQVTKVLNDFLLRVNYLNPRSLIKVLNKYMAIYELEIHKNCFNIYTMIVDLFFIILDESYPNVMRNIMQYMQNILNFFLSNKKYITIQYQYGSDNSTGKSVQILKKAGESSNLIVEKFFLEKGCGQPDYNELFQFNYLPIKNNLDFAMKMIMSIIPFIDSETYDYLFEIGTTVSDNKNNRSYNSFEEFLSGFHNENKILRDFFSFVIYHYGKVFMTIEGEESFVTLDEKLINYDNQTFIDRLEFIEKYL